MTNAIDLTALAAVKPLPKLNVEHVPSFSMARMEYTSAPKMVQKARPVSDLLREKIEKAGFTVAEPKAPCPFGDITKSSAFAINFGKSANYMRIMANHLDRVAGIGGEYEKSHRDTGMFPLFGEMLFAKWDLSCIYLRAFPQAGDTRTPEVHYFSGEKEINVLQIVQWLPSAEFQKYNEGQEHKSAIKAVDEQGNESYIVAQDEQGNPMFDEHGNPVLVPYPEVRTYKLYEPLGKNPRPLKIFIKGNNLVNEILQFDNLWDMEELAEVAQKWKDRFNAGESL